jgi:hypothetical protein
MGIHEITSVELEEAFGKMSVPDLLWKYGRMWSTNYVGAGRNELALRELEKFIRRAVIREEFAVQSTTVKELRHHLVIWMADTGVRPHPEGWHKDLRDAEKEVDALIIAVKEEGRGRCQ